jgi:excisionase family DNA binding protein
MVQEGDRLWLHFGEAANALGLGKSTVHELINRSELRPARVGRALRIPVAELKRWADAQVESAAEEVGGRSD